MRRRAPLCLVLAATLLGACGLLRSQSRPEVSLAPVALVLEGSAFEQRGLREKVVALVAEAAGRPVVVVDRPPDAGLTKRAARLASEVPAIGRYDRREPRCAKEQAIVTAVAARADAVYRLRLDYTAATRTMTAAERSESSSSQGMSGVLAAVGLAARDTVLEESLAGLLERTTFESGPQVERRSIERRERHLVPSALTPRLDARDAVGAALHDLRPLAPPQWGAVARRLVSNGCPLLALAVGDTLVRDEAAQRKLHALAVAAIQRKVAARKPRGSSAADVPSEVMPDIAPETAAKSVGPSCRELCDLHMVELCNNDRTLWSQHRAAWASTRCGLRRPETFLETCYRMQWLDGTYERACLEPCQASADGRERLVMLLRRAGCLRTGQISG